MSKPIIYRVPCELLTTKEIEGEGYKKFIVTTYLDFCNNVNNEGICYNTLANLLTNGCGFAKPTGTYGQDIYKQLKGSLRFLQQKNYIGDITNYHTREIVDVMTAKPRDLMCFDLENLCTEPTTNFMLISHDDYIKIKNIDYSGKAFMFWKTLVMYMYVSSCLGYNPKVNKCAHEYYVFGSHHTHDDLCEGFSPTTVQNLFALLKENKLIEYEITYIKDSPEMPPRRIGKVTILSMGDDQDEIEYRLQQAKKRARIECARCEPNDTNVTNPFGVF